MTDSTPAPGRRAILGGLLAAAALAGCTAKGQQPAATVMPAAIRPRASGAPPVRPAERPAFSYVAENRLRGIGRRSVPTHWTSDARLSGFLGQHASTARQRKIQLYVSSTVGSVRIMAFRLGDYAGAGQRLVWSSGPVAVRPQKHFDVDPVTRMVSCDWDVTTEIDTAAWPEGFYYLVLAAAGSAEHLIPLVVESGSLRGKAVVVLNDLTMQAYNHWGGHSLYAGAHARFLARSYKVTFDRPYQNHGELDKFNSPLVRAAEAMGDDRISLGYTTEARLTLEPGLLAGVHALLFSGHTEYWPAALRRTVEGARDQGTNVVFFGANSVYWRVRTEPSRLGPERVLVCYKDWNRDLDPVRYRHPELDTTIWREGSRPDPESILTGAIYDDVRVSGAFTVSDPGFFAYQGTGVSRGEKFPGLVGGEVDRVLTRFKHPSDLHVFAHSAASGRVHAHGWADSTAYLAASGAGVIDMASLNWLKAQRNRKVPLRSRRFAIRVTQNIIRAVSAGPLGTQYRF